ncbi:MAG TPA: hypothetical protein VMX18_02655 [Candidatus Bipolaricaulota bacterium]|nr:hypothetical protein [Candidatus Bipolaricaulota bacterium]
MLETSKDVLYIVLSFCLIWLTAFLCWALFYLTRLLKQSNEVVSEVRDKLEDFFDALERVKEKIESGLQIAGVVSDGVKNLVKYLADKRKSK